MAHTPRTKARKTPPKRRMRSPHPGVKLTLRHYRTGTATWRGIYTDPDTGKPVAVNLDKLGLTDGDARVNWAKQRARDLAARRLQIELGIEPEREPEPVAASPAIATAVDRYLEARRHELRASTVAGYGRTLALLVSWASGEGIERLRELDRHALARFRHWLATTGRRTPVRGGARGERTASDSPPSPASINRRLREVKAFLYYVEEAGETPSLSERDIKRSLRRQRAPRPQPSPLSAGQCKALLTAALRHDAETYAKTRAEHREHPALRALHRTNRFDPIAPLVAFLLLSGCRVSEALHLRWSNVHLDAPDDAGNVVGEIRLPASATKTHVERRIDLAVSPALLSLLERLKLRTGRGEFVFGGTKPSNRNRADAARKRLVERFGAPTFTWQQLRQTCASYLTNAPGIFRAASIYNSAEQLGHSPDVARRHYLGRIRGIADDARTVEAAMRVENVLDALVRLPPAEALERIGDKGAA